MISMEPRSRSSHSVDAENMAVVRTSLSILAVSATPLAGGTWRAAARDREHDTHYARRDQPDADDDLPALPPAWCPPGHHLAHHRAQRQDAAHQQHARVGERARIHQCAHVHEEERHEEVADAHDAFLDLVHLRGGREQQPGGEGAFI